MSGLLHQQLVLNSEQPGSASLSKAEGLQFSSRRRTWLTDPDTELPGPCEHEGGKLLWGNWCLSLRAPSSLMVAHPPHFPISTVNTIIPADETQIFLCLPLPLSLNYTFSFSKTPKKCGQRLLILGVGREGSFLQVQHLKIFRFRLVEFKGSMEFHVSSQIPGPILEFHSSQYFPFCHLPAIKPWKRKLFHLIFYCYCLVTSFVNSSRVPFNQHLLTAYSVRDIWDISLR